MRTAWPDGGAFLDQPEILVRVFEFIGGIVNELSEAERNSTL